jgi:hypothetical protein
MSKLASKMLWIIVVLAAAGTRRPLLRDADRTGLVSTTGIAPAAIVSSRCE